MKISTQEIETIKKNQIKTLELKTTITVLKKYYRSSKSDLISQKKKLEDRSLEIIESVE